MADGELTLHEAAAELGVHYMTAYRYVRLGLLHADKQSGTWRVSRDALTTFAERAATPGARTDGAAVTSDADGRGRRRAPWAARLEDRLIAGDTAGAWGVVEAALAAGSDLEDIYLDVLTPAMWGIGRRWEAGEIDVADEHRATGIALRLTGRLGPRFARRGRTRGTVVLACPQGERHALPLAIIGDLVRGHGFFVSDLGADVPHDSLVRLVAAVDDLVVVGLSVSGREFIPSTTEAIRALRSGGVDAAVVVGGHAVAADGEIDTAVASALGADVVAVDGRDFVRIVEGLAPGR
jgi:excisionase family DNA binding protein